MPNTQLVFSCNV